MATIDKRTTADGTTTYRVRVRKLGYPTRTKTFARKTDAQAWARHLEAKIDKGQSIPDQDAARKTLADAIDKYLKDTLPHKARNKNDRNVRRILQWWRDELGAYTLPSLTPAVITEARDKLRRTRYKRKGKGGTSLDKERSPGTVNRYLVTLSAVLRTVADEWMWLETTPMAKVKKLGEPRGRVRFLSDDERKQLLEACGESTSTTLYPIVVLALSTGMRQGEILGLTWDRVNLSRGTIILEETKNGERRTVPLVGHAAQMMQQYRRVHRRVDTPIVFPSERGHKHAEVRQSWQNAVKRAGLKDFRFHDLRHSAASYLAMNGATLTEIAEVLGHKTLAMVKRYSHLTEQHTAAVVSRMNERVFGDG
jgi:integrase